MTVRTLFHIATAVVISAERDSAVTAARARLSGEPIPVLSKGNRWKLAAIAHLHRDWFTAVGLQHIASARLA